METNKRTNKCYIYLVIFLTIAVFYITYEPFKAFSSEVVMLFTSNSVESIIGYLNSYYYIRPVVSIALMLLQALIFPFKYEIMIFANIKVFGGLIGLCLSLIGRIIGAYISYDIGKALLSNKIDLIINKFNISEAITNYMRNNDLAHLLLRILPLNFDLVSYIAGILQLDPKKYMLNSIVWIIFTTVLYSIKKGYYNYSYEMGMIYLRLILSILAFIIIMRKNNINIGIR